ncbi:hypothetical protein [Metasolibacillus meyeri]|uniref:hypothetical protein n=1 Tax=Metasolibacillus meyeri TaxID=1071052 RepID=UPI000D309544|nr:hypothetical protein [Metasolibacillus meyeri]
MTRKRIVMGVLLLLIVAFASYRLYISKPQTFIQEEEIIRQLKELAPKIVVQTIEEIIQVDDKHYFVPILTEDGRQVSLYYQWEKGQWQISYMGVGQNTSIYGWQLDPDDPRSIVFVWHFPKDTINNLDLYLIERRNAFVSDGYQYYRPKIQMKETFHIDKHYGVREVSEAFTQAIHQLDANRYAQSSFIFDMFMYHEPPLFYAKYSYKNVLSEGQNWYGRGGSQIHYILDVTNEVLE